LDRIAAIAAYCQTQAQRIMGVVLVGPSVGLLVTLVSHAETAELIEMPFGVATRVFSLIVISFLL